jgi:ABC-type multidrug transport system fused ATPase/permease subunit
MTIGKIMYHVMLFSNVTAPITQLQRIFDQMNDALIYAEGFFDILEADGEIEPTGKYRPKRVEGNFELSGVDFTYPNGTKALHDINMKIESGKITALVGLSGAGKSTVLNLLVKFYSPDCGSIKLDGVDLRDYDTKFLRDNIGMVLQKNHIFDGSIEENIRYGLPNATREQVEEAARKAYIYDQIMKLPNGFESKAQLLSGGQQQRIAIARMFLKNPPILILDEATSALDNTTEILIQQSLDELCKGRTTIVVAHRLSTVKNADKIAVIANGSIIEQGNHEQLIAKGGKYAELYNLQFKNF